MTNTTTVRSLASYMTQQHALACCDLLRSIYGGDFTVMPPTNNILYYQVGTTTPTLRNVKLVLASFNAGLLAGQGIS